MAKNTKTSPARVSTIFDDLDSYRAFCVNYGYSFDEADLYSQRSYVYRQFQKFQAGKTNIKNQWEVDLAKFKEQEAQRSGSKK